LPLDQLEGGLVYNATVFQKYGINPDDIKTMTDLGNAFNTIKTKSNGTVTPIAMAGGDGWPVGQIFDTLSTGYFTTAAQNDISSLEDGSFDWSKWTSFVSIIQGWSKDGYFAKDMLTQKFADNAKDLANGKVAVSFYGESIVYAAMQYNPNFKPGDMPMPATWPGDTGTVLTGENATFGIWKDSKYTAQAEQLLDMFAEPENIQTFCQAEQLPAGLSGETVDLGWFNPYVTKYANVRKMGVFDRTYLPNGIWDTMTNEGAALIAGSLTPTQFSSDMKSEYTRLRSTT
jgi:raffinose/stachyose/melibiose transport system substrate-binding protein